MEYQITINTDNAAFVEGGSGGREQIETARILRSLADDIEHMGLCEYNLIDFNGNRVGEAGEA